MNETTEAPSKAVSKTALKKNAVHEGVTLPSGSTVTVRIPNVELMIKAGQVPNELIEAAIKVQNAQPQSSEEAKKIVEDNWDFTEFIVPQVLVEPQIEPSDVGDMDARDVQMLADFASRREDMDAVGHQLGGLETQKSFRNYRGIADLDEIMEGMS